MPVQTVKQKVRTSQHPAALKNRASTNDRCFLVVAMEVTDIQDAQEVWLHGSYSNCTNEND